MARKTPKAVQAMIAEHDETVAYWVHKQTNWNDQPVTDEFRIGILTGLNIMLETALHKHSCYQGFRFVKHRKAQHADTLNVVGDGYILDWNNHSTQREDTVAYRLAEQTRSYFVKF